MSNLNWQERVRKAYKVEVCRLVELAYAEFPNDYQHRMALDTFCGSLGNAPLQRLLLDVETTPWSRLSELETTLTKYKRPKKGAGS